MPRAFFILWLVLLAAPCLGSDVRECQPPSSTLFPGDRWALSQQGGVVAQASGGHLSIWRDGRWNRFLGGTVDLLSISPSGARVAACHYAENTLHLWTSGGALLLRKQAVVQELHAHERGVIMRQPAGTRARPLWLWTALGDDGHVLWSRTTRAREDLEDSNYPQGLVSGPRFLIVDPLTAEGFVVNASSGSLLSSIHPPAGGAMPILMTCGADKFLLAYRQKLTPVGLGAWAEHGPRIYRLWSPGPAIQAVTFTWIPASRGPLEAVSGDLRYAVTRNDLHGLTLTDCRTRKLYALSEVRGWKRPAPRPWYGPMQLAFSTDSPRLQMVFSDAMLETIALNALDWRPVSPP